MYRRINAYVDLAQGSYNLESYIRRRQEAANTLAADAVVVPEIIERALLVRSLEPSLSTELMRKVGWWDKPVATLITEAIATDKAKRSSETRKPAKPQLSRTKSHYLSVAAGRHTGRSNTRWCRWGCYPVHNSFSHLWRQNSTDMEYCSERCTNRRI